MELAGEFKKIVLNDLHRPEWLFEEILDFIREKGVVDDIEIIKRFRMRVDILANVLTTLRIEGKIKRSLNEQRLCVYSVIDEESD